MSAITDENPNAETQEQANTQTDALSSDDARAERREQANPQAQAARTELLTGPRTVQAVLERWEEGAEESHYAVLLVGDAEREFILPAHRMPPGTHEGAWLQLKMEGDRILSLSLDAETTTTRRARVQTKRSLLKGRGRKLTPRKK